MHERLHHYGRSERESYIPIIINQFKYHKTASQTSSLGPAVEQLQIESCRTDTSPSLLPPPFSPMVLFKRPFRYWTCCPTRSYNRSRVPRFQVRSRSPPLHAHYPVDILYPQCLSFLYAVSRTSIFFIGHVLSYSALRICVSFLAFFFLILLHSHLGIFEESLFSFPSQDASGKLYPPSHEKINILNCRCNITQVFPIVNKLRRVQRVPKRKHEKGRNHSPLSTERQTNVLRAYDLRLAGRDRGVRLREEIGSRP